MTTIETLQAKIGDLRDQLAKRTKELTRVRAESVDLEAGPREKASYKIAGLDAECRLIAADIEAAEDELQVTRHRQDTEAAQALVLRRNPARQQRITERVIRIGECEREAERLRGENVADLADARRDQLSAEVVAAHYGLPSPVPAGEAPLLKLTVPHGAGDTPEQIARRRRRALHDWEKRHAKSLTLEAQQLIERRALGEMRTDKQLREAGLLAPKAGVEDPDLGRAMAEAAAIQTGISPERMSLGPQRRTPTHKTVEADGVQIDVAFAQVPKK